MGDSRRQTLVLPERNLVEEQLDGEELGFQGGAL